MNRFRRWTASVCSDRRLFLSLAAIEIFGRRLHIFSTGYYLDDWWEMWLAAQSSLGAAIKAYANVGYLDRPLNMILLVLLHRASGPLDPLRAMLAQAALAALEIAEAWLFFRVLERLTRWRSLAFVAAGILLLFPDRAGIHYRVTLLCLHFSLVLVLASLLEHLRWMKMGGWRALMSSQALYLLAMLFYELPMLMPLLIAGGAAARGAAEGKSRRDLLWEAARCLAPYGVALLVVITWKWVGIRAIWGTANMKTSVLSPSWSNAVKVFAAGLGCTSLWVLSFCAVRLRDALAELRWLWLPLPFFAAWLTALLRPSHDDRPSELAPAIAATIGAAGGCFIGSYAPFVLSDAYMPYVNGIMSRLNSTGAWSGAMLLALGVSYCAGALADATGRRARFLSFVPAVVFAAFVWTSWTESAAWARAWRLQKVILGEILSAGVEVSGGHPKPVILTGAPRFIHGAPVFEGDYDLTPALRLLSGRRDVSGMALSGRMKAAGREMVEEYRGKTIRRLPFDDVVVYDHRTRGFVPALDVAFEPFPETSFWEKAFLGPGMEW